MPDVENQENKGKMSGRSEDEQVTRGVRFDRSVLDELDEIAEHSGIKAADLHRLALNRLVSEVRETGRVPIPEMPVAGTDEKGDAA